jgi:hypothetical protein
MSCENALLFIFIMILRSTRQYMFANISFPLVKERDLLQIGESASSSYRFFLVSYNMLAA